MDLNESEKKYYPVTTDLVFKTVFINKDLMQCLLNECFEENVEIIEYQPTETKIENKKEKHKRLDLLIKLKDRLVNVEVNTSYSKNVKYKNFAYLCKLHGQNLEIAEANVYQSESVQINLNLGTDGPLKTVYEMYSPKHKLALGVLFKYIEINLDKYREFWYDKNEKEIKKNTLLVAISMTKEKELNEFVEYTGNENVRRIRDKVKNINEDDMYASELSYEERKELEHIQLMKNSKIEGEKEGLAEGQSNEKIRMANKLLALNKMTLEEISELTELSTEELNKLKEKLQK